MEEDQQNREYVWGPWRRRAVQIPGRGEEGKRGRVWRMNTSIPRPGFREYLEAWVVGVRLSHRLCGKAPMVIGWPELCLFLSSHAGPRQPLSDTHFRSAAGCTRSMLRVYMED